MTGGKTAGLLATALVGLGVWFLPPPEGLSLQAWRLFGIFAAAIFSVVVNALPILAASVIAAAAAVLLRIVPPEKAYAGFSNGTILLIVLAFLVARAVVKCGLGTRIGHAIVTVFGRSTLGLAYSIFLVDALIAPAFPSNTARSGVLYPLTVSLADAAGAKPGDPTRQRLGMFLMFSGIASLSLSSALWLTAMAANPLGAEIAAPLGVTIGFGSWLVAASVPTLAAIALMPMFLYKIIRPEVTSTPDAPAAARRALQALGPMTRSERIVAATCVGLVTLWALGATLHIDSTAVAFLGLGVLLVTRALTMEDIAKEGDVLSTFIWFAVLFALSSELNDLGFMGFVGQRLAHRLDGLPGLWAGISIVVSYVALHYLFVSQTAHLLALFGVFLGVGSTLGVGAKAAVGVAPLAFQLLFATNYFSVLTPQASSANLLFAGSGYLTQGQLYKLGAITTIFSMVLYLTIGTAWLLVLFR